MGVGNSQDYMIITQKDINITVDRIGTNPHNKSIRTIA